MNKIKRRGDMNKVLCLGIIFLMACATGVAGENQENRAEQIDGFPAAISQDFLFNLKNS
jgi:hypothetical protein